MKIAILGTKGIPNNYGGYEQFAEYISTRLIERGHAVTVYNPHYHKFSGKEFNGVRIIKKYSPESFMGGAANIIYDHLCLKDALRQDFDIIYEAGYHSVALSYKWLNVKRLKKPVVITNMDGLEWRRSKWNAAVQYIIKGLERIAVYNSPHLISDNEGIRDYLIKKYNTDSHYIPYGADPVEKFDITCLKEYNVEAGIYLMLVARLEPENNIETIIEGHTLASSIFPLLIIGNHNTRYGAYLKDKFKSEKIRFVGGIYNKGHLDTLRHFSLAYFHGHSVGGTNPSLLEAMASQTFIIAHKNPFNGAILGDSALFFDNANEIKEYIDNIKLLRAKHATEFVHDNFNKIKSVYNWAVIVSQHENLFKYLLTLNK